MYVTDKWSWSAVFFPVALSSIFNIIRFFTGLLLVSYSSLTGLVTLIFDKSINISSMIQGGFAAILFNHQTAADVFYYLMMADILDETCAGINY